MAWEEINPQPQDEPSTGLSGSVRLPDSLFYTEIMDCQDSLCVFLCLSVCACLLKVSVCISVCSMYVCVCLCLTVWEGVLYEEGSLYIEVDLSWALV